MTSKLCLTNSQLTGNRRLECIPARIVGDGPTHRVGPAARITGDMADVPPPPLSYAAPPLVGALPIPEPVSTADVPRQLAAAAVAWRPIGRAVRYATFDAWTLAVCGVLSLPCMGVDAAGVVGAVVLCAIAAVEFRGVARLRRLDPAAPRLLATNQWALTAAILLYAVWNLYLTRTNGGVMGLLLAQGLDQGGPGMVEGARQIVYVMYAGLAVVGPAATAGAAWFYASRSARLHGYLAVTPPWIVQMQREGGRV